MVFLWVSLPVSLCGGNSEQPVSNENSCSYQRTVHCTTDHSAKYNSLKSFCFSFLMDEKTKRRCDQTSQKQICWAGSSRLGLLRSPFTRVVLSQAVRPYSPARPRRPPSAVLPSLPAAPPAHLRLCQPPRWRRSTRSCPSTSTSTRPPPSSSPPSSLASSACTTSEPHSLNPISLSKFPVPVCLFLPLPIWLVSQVPLRPGVAA